MRLEVTFGMYVREIGIAGQLSVLVFIATFAFSVLIFIRRLDRDFRLSLIPLSLLPIALGIFGISAGAIDAISSLRTGSVRDDIGGLYYFSEVAQVLPLAAAESCILLLISSLLVMTSPRRTE